MELAAGRNTLTCPGHDHSPQTSRLWGDPQALHQFLLVFPEPPELFFCQPMFCSCSWYTISVCLSHRSVSLLQNRGCLAAGPQPTVLLSTHLANLEEGLKPQQEVDVDQFDLGFRFCPKFWLLQIKISNGDFVFLPTLLLTLIWEFLCIHVNPHRLNFRRTALDLPSLYFLLHYIYLTSPDPTPLLNFSLLFM